MRKRSLKGTLFPALMAGALFLGAAGEAAAGHRTGGGGGQRAASRPSGGSGGVAMRSPGVPRSTVAMRPSGLSSHGGVAIRGGTAVRPGSPPVNVRGRAVYGYGGHGGHVHVGWGWGLYGGYWPYYGYYWPYYYPSYYYPSYYPYYGYSVPPYTAPYGYSAPSDAYPPADQYEPYQGSGEPGGEAMPEGPPAWMETDVAPGGATVKLDGLDVGQAKDYDGRYDKLSVPPGLHIIEFEAEGYKTLHLEINVRPGGHYRFGYDLYKGEGFDPRSKALRKPQTQQAQPQSAPQQDYYAPPPRPAPQTYTPPQRSAPPPSSQVYQAPPQRSAPPPQIYEDASGSAPTVFDATPDSTADGAEDLPQAAKGESGQSSGFLKMRVSPSDATVYLDGKFFARADEISGLHGAVPVPAGDHRIEVVRPGYTTRVVKVHVETGRSSDVSVDLKQEADL